ncbi:MAG: YpdA family putative bacillithiol disulfide reductase [Spirosomataceae bacterium]
MTNFDLIIVGGGPIGLACGLAAQEAGLSYIILEKGCLVNSIYNYPSNMTFFSTSERLEIGGVPFISVNPKPTRQEALEYYRRVVVSKNIQIELFEEVVQVLPKEGNMYQVVTSKGVYETKFIVVATGFYDIPVSMNVPGESLPKVSHYYKDPHFYALQKVVVVGANNSAVDAALETWRKGADVTMVIKGDKIGERVKYWARPDIVNRIEEGSIRAFYSSQIKEIKEQSVVITTQDGEVEVANDWVIALTGYQPNLPFLEKMGIQLAEDALKKPTFDEQTMETNLSNVFLAGVVCGGMETHRLFIENSRIHANLILARIKELIA